MEPIDFEEFIVKNRTVIQNDPHRELLLYPSDDVMVRMLIGVACLCSFGGRLAWNEFSDGIHLTEYSFDTVGES